MPVVSRDQDRAVVNRLLLTAGLGHVAVALFWVSIIGLWFAVMQPIIVGQAALSDQMSLLNIGLWIVFGTLGLGLFLFSLVGRILLQVSEGTAAGRRVLGVGGMLISLLALLVIALVRINTNLPPVNARSPIQAELAVFMRLMWPLAAIGIAMASAALWSVVVSYRPSHATGLLLIALIIPPTLTLFPDAIGTALITLTDPMDVPTVVPAVVTVIAGIYALSHVVAAGFAFRTRIPSPASPPSAG